MDEKGLSGFRFHLMELQEATKMSGARLEALEKCYGLWK